MLRDQLFTNPAVVFLGCVVWIPISIWVIAFVHWMIGGEVDPTTGLIGIVCSVGLGGMLVKPPNPSIAVVGFLAIATITLIFPFARAALNKRSLRSVDVEAIERAYGVLRERPNNPASRMRIARHLHTLGFPAHAIQVMQSALRELPSQFFQDEHRMLAMWRSLPLSANDFRPIPCPRCSAPVDASQTVLCRHCGSEVFADRLRGRFISNSVGRRLVAIWLIVVALALGIGGTPSLPSPFNLVTALASVGVLAFGVASLARSAGAQP